MQVIHDHFLDLYLRCMLKINIREDQGIQDRMRIFLRQYALTTISHPDMKTLNGDNAKSLSTVRS